jgi:O-antigen/teichoic acid export membrane protein
MVPFERKETAYWVFQFSILTFLVNLLVVPYNAVIIANEKMNIYAYLSLFEVILKLLVVILLGYFSCDKLKLYSILIFLSTVLSSLLYVVVCRKKFSEYSIHFFWDRDMFYSLISFSSWNLFGAVGSILSNEGVNLILNTFYGPVINTARGISYQIGNSVNQFVLSFTMAINPQITKSYAMDDKDGINSLVNNGSKYSFFLMIFLSLPLIFEASNILKFLFGVIPTNVIIFSRLIVINGLIDSLSYTLQTLAQATGKIKWYQTVVGGLILLNTPISYIFLIFKYPPQVTFYVSIVISILCLLARLLFLRHMVGFSIKLYYMNVIKPVFLTTLLSCIPPIASLYIIENEAYKTYVVIALSLLSTILAIYYLGLTKNEKKYFIHYITFFRK